MIRRCVEGERRTGRRQVAEEGRCDGGDRRRQRRQGEEEDVVTVREKEGGGKVKRKM